MPGITVVQRAVINFAAQMLFQLSFIPQLHILIAENLVAGFFDRNEIVHAALI